MSLPSWARPRSALWVAGLAAVGTASAPWWAPASASGSGNAAQVLSLAALAGTLLLSMLASKGRRALGVLIAALFAGGAVLGFLHPAPAVTDTSLVATPWPYVHALSALFGLAAALWLVRVSGRRASPAVPASRAPVEDSQATWKAMDQGIDPTDDRKEHA